MQSIDTDQLSGASIHEDGEDISDPGDAVDERERDHVVLSERGSRVVEEVEHAEEDDRLQRHVEEVDGVFG